MALLMVDGCIMYCILTLEWTFIFRSCTTACMIIFL